MPEVAHDSVIGLPDKNSQSAVELLMSQYSLLDNLRKVHMGNYGIILSLLGCLDHGLQAKKLVDRVIDASTLSHTLPLPIATDQSTSTSAS